MTDHHLLILPGWKSSGPQHWQSIWQQTLPHCSRVEQKNWFQPIRSHWIESLEWHVQQAPKPVVLVAHSLGCITVAHWARFNEERVLGALLVAPADVERRRTPHELRNFAPIPRKSLPFPSLVVGSTTDPTCTAERARELAHSWGSEFVQMGPVGHLNVESGHGHWPEGVQLLERLIRLGHLLKHTEHEFQMQEPSFQLERF